MSNKQFDQKLTDLLKTNPNYLDDTGELHREHIKNKAWDFDKVLVNLLLTDDTIASHFFEEVSEGRYIFNNKKFVQYISDMHFLDNSYTRFKNKIGLTIDDKHLRERGEVSLVWPYKDCVLEGGQTKEDQKRKEVFFNEILAQDEITRMFDPKVLTNWKRHTAAGEQDVTEIKRDDNGDLIRENLIIKGNNLIALHTLKQQFRGQVKLIYIDPPYNTGNDSFGYNDNFNHSSWLTFMKNRLEVAKTLLRNDGVIFVHIDDREMHYLKVVADDIFGRDNFIATVPRKTRSGRSNVPHNLSQDFDWMLMYTNKVSKKVNLFQRTISRKYYKTPDFPNDEWRLSDITVQATIIDRPNCNYTLINPKNGQKFPVNPNRCWGFPKDTFQDNYKQGKIIFPGDYEFLNIKKPAMRVFKSEEIGKKGEDYDKGSVSSDFLNQAMDELLKSMVNRKGTDEIMELFGRKAFAYPKNELLMQRIIEYTTTESDIVLDFHLGSGTTAAVAHKTGRQYIGIEQMDYADTISVERLNKVIGGEQGGISEEVKWSGGGSFLYCELMSDNQTYIDRIQSATDSDTLLDLWRQMCSSASVLKWYLDTDNIEAAEKEFIAIDDIAKQKTALLELIDKAHLYVHYSEMEDANANVSDTDKRLNHLFYKGNTDAKI